MKPGSESLTGPARARVAAEIRLVVNCLWDGVTISVLKETLFLWSVDHGLADVVEPADISAAEGVLRKNKIGIKYSYAGNRYGLLYLDQPAQASEAAAILREADIEWLDLVDTVGNCNMNHPGGGDVALFLRNGFGFGFAKRLESPRAVHGGTTETERRVAFFLHCPGVVSPRRIEAEVMQTDFLPTVLDVLGIPPPGSIAGRSIYCKE